MIKFRQILEELAMNNGEIDQFNGMPHPKNHPLSQPGLNFLRATVGSHHYGQHKLETFPDLTPKNVRKESIDEVTLLDNRPKKKPIDPAKAKAKADRLAQSAALVEKHGDNPDYPMLKHPAVKFDHPNEIRRYMTMMDHAKTVVPKGDRVMKRMKAGHDKYMSGVKLGEDPRVTQEDKLQESKSITNGYRKKNFGYTTEKKGYLRGNTKTDKNIKEGDLTAGWAMAPHNMAGIPGETACPQATERCKHSCISTAGQNGMLGNVNSKIANSLELTTHPEHVYRRVHAELLDHIDKVHEFNKEREAGKHPGSPEMTASFRPNMFTDYNHHHIMGPLLEHVHHYASSLK